MSAPSVPARVLGHFVAPREVPTPMSAPSVPARVLGHFIAPREVPTP